jgi:hypothetical protein
LNAQAQESQLSSAMKTDYEQRFGQQSSIIDGITRALSPALEGGASAHGFSAEELAARNTQAINSVGAANRNAQQAVAGQLAGRGGDSGIESGIDKQIKATISSKMASDLASKQTDITNADWATGRDEYHRALAGEDFLAGKVLNPEAFGQLATSANDKAFSEADAINKANNQKWADIGGLITSAASAIPKGISGLKGMFGSGNLSDEDN